MTYVRPRHRLVRRARISFRAVAAFILLSSAALAVTVGGQGASATNPCARDMYFIGVRGSGEHYHYGETIGDIFAELQILNPTGVQGDYVDYPAVDVATDTGYPARYYESVQTGIDNLAQKINDIQQQVGSCWGSTGLYLAGYSQGAQVVGDMITDNAGQLTQDQLDHIRGVALMADPRYDGSQPGGVDQGTATSPKAHGIYTITPLSGTTRYIGSSFQPRVHSYCMGNDPICNFSPGNAAMCSIGGDSCVHLHYMDISQTPGGPTYTELAAQFLLSTYPLPVIVTTSLPDGHVGAPYSAQLTTADHRVGTWQITGGTIPPGLSQNPNSYTLSGTPTTPGNYSMFLFFTDTSNRYATAWATLNVYAAGAGPGGSPTNATATHLSSSANPSVYGQTVTLSATVTSSAGTPTGRVDFYDGGNELGWGSLSGGSAAVSTAFDVGTHDITAYYSGGGNYAASSAHLQQVVTKDATTTAVASSANPSVYCQRVAFPSTVSAAPPGSGTPTGTVAYTDNGAAIGSNTLSGGSTSISKQFFTVGTHPIVASYGGDDNFLSSVSPTLYQVVNKAPTVTTLAGSPAGQNLFGHQTTLTATVSVPPPGCGTPTGTVRFGVDGVPVQNAPLSSALTAQMSTTALIPGQHVLSATYSGDPNFLGSVGTVNYLITCTRTLTGNVSGGVLASGESTCLVNATLSGSVTVPAGTRFAAVNSTLGAISAAGNSQRGVGMISLCGDRVNGGISIYRSAELVMVGDPAAACAPNRVYGSMTIVNNPAGVEVLGNVDSSDTFSQDSGPGPYGQPSTMVGNIHAR